MPYPYDVYYIVLYRINRADCKMTDDEVTCVGLFATTPKSGKVTPNGYVSINRYIYY